MFEGIKCVQNKIVFRQKMLKTYHISDYDNDFEGIRIKADKCIESKLYLMKI